MPQSLVSSAATSPFTRSTRLARLDDLLRERILVLDGGMGTLVQSYQLTESDFRGERFRDHSRDLRGNTDLICLTRPDIATAIHGAYLDAGADVAGLPPRMPPVVERKTRLSGLQASAPSP